MFSYIGGKSKIGKWIKNFIPTDIEIYVEPFSGAFWVYFNLDLEKFQNLKSVVYNDINSLNYNLFYCIKNPEFYHYIKDIPSQEKIRFEDYKKNIFNKSLKKFPDFQLGLEYIYVITQVFSGTNPEKGNFVDLKGKYTSKFDSFKKRLCKDDYLSKINRISNIENNNFSESIDKWDGSKTFFYLDPPYYNCEKYYANHNFGKEKHKILSEKLKSIKGKFALSYYYFDDLLEWFPKDKFSWVEKEFCKVAGASKNKSTSKGKEILITNYPTIG